MSHQPLLAASRAVAVALSILLTFGLLATTGPVAAQEGAPGEGPGAGITEEQARAALLERLRSFGWTDGPAEVELRQLARIDLPEGYSFLDGDGARKLLSLYDNRPSDREVGLFGRTDGLDGWFVVFEFNDIGYVKDDEKDEIDPDALLESFRENNRQANEWRKSKGIPTLRLVGWKTEPRYNEETQNLEWCLHAESDSGPVLNHNIRILGRKGVMEVTLVCSPAELDSSLGEVRDVLAGFAYQEGQRYGDFEAGDKIAKYGLTALVAGGALAVAAKTGILQKLIKPLIIGLVVAAGAVGSFFKRLFGGGGGKSDTA